jgi:predicted alpha/beta-hydrolase family hydrolase
MRTRVTTLATTRGAARLTWTMPTTYAALAVLMHGAGGDSSSPVLLEVADRLAARGVGVVRLDQPYRVAGRRAPDPADRLDDVALEVVRHVRARRRGVPLVLGGKSSGARVACRVAERANAAAVVALGFPLRPPGRPERSRAAELLAVDWCPVLVLQGERDTFGTPADVGAILPRRSPVTLHAVAGGDHSFAARRADGRTTRECLDEVASVTADWVGAVLAQAT